MRIAPLSPSNRTSLELKQRATASLYIPIRTSNRTSLKLTPLLPALFS